LISSEQHIASKIKVLLYDKNTHGVTLVYEFSGVHQ